MWQQQLCFTTRYTSALHPYSSSIAFTSQQRVCQHQQYTRVCINSQQQLSLNCSYFSCSCVNFTMCDSEPHSLSVVCNRRTCGLPRPAPGSFPPPAVGDKRGREWGDGAGMGSASAPQRNGDWVCEKCNNLNFSSREVHLAALFMLCTVSCIAWRCWRHALC